jgi:hypothetical protein
MENDLYDEPPPVDQKDVAFGSLCIGPRHPPLEPPLKPPSPVRLCLPAFNLFGFLLGGGCGGSRGGLNADAQDAANRFGI